MCVLGRWLWCVLRVLTTVVSGEFILETGHPNGGTMIFVRSVWVTTLIYALALALQSGSYAEWTWRVSTWRIDSGQLQHDVAEYVSWLGAIFAGVYVALYARFASQWSYLAGVYNQMRQTLVTTPKHDDDPHLVMWRAGFIEDALDLHLATKPMFSPFLLRMLDMPPVAAKFDAYAVDGKKRRKQLEDRLKKKGGQMPRRAATELLSKELPELLGIVQADDLDPLGKKLVGGNVFQDLTDNDARRVAFGVVWVSILQDRACADAARVVTERAKAAETGADGIEWDDRAAAGQALHSAAKVLANVGDAGQPRRPIREIAGECWRTLAKHRTQIARAYTD